MNQNDILDYSPQDIARGYMKTADGWQCLLCNARFEDGVVYSIGDRQYEAGRAAREHIGAAHGSVFLHLLETQMKYTGLTERQAETLRLTHAGLSDKAVAARLSCTDNTASVRNLRFHLKERERQAKAFLALMEAFRLERAVKTDESSSNALLPVHAGATLADERFTITEKEYQAVLKTYFAADGSLKDFPVREKRKIIALREIAGRFERSRAYTEKEVNTIIAWHDFATVRRYLIEYGFMERTVDCGEYRLKEERHDPD